MSLKTQRFNGIVKEGKIVLDDPQAMVRTVSFLEGLRVVLTLARWYKKRTLSENNYYWAVVVQMIADHTGNTPEQVHKGLGEMFWPDEEAPTFTLGKRVFSSEAKSTTEFNTAEFEEKMKLVRNWAATSPDDPTDPGLGLYIPEPNEDPERWLKV